MTIPKQVELAFETAKGLNPCLLQQELGAGDLIVGAFNLVRLLERWWNREVEFQAGACNPDHLYLQHHQRQLDHRSRNHKGAIYNHAYHDYYIYRWSQSSLLARRNRRGERAHGLRCAQCRHDLDENEVEEILIHVQTILTNGALERVMVFNSKTATIAVFLSRGLRRIAKLESKALFFIAFRTAETGTTTREWVY